MVLGERRVVARWREQHLQVCPELGKGPSLK